MSECSAAVCACCVTHATDGLSCVSFMTSTPFFASVKLVLEDLLGMSGVDSVY